MIAFYVAAAVAVIATALVITRREAIHALLYLIVSLLAVAVAFYVLGAPFIAALEVIVYAGAIMVLLVFVVMLLNLGPGAEEREGLWASPSAWVGPSLLAAVLVVEIASLLVGGGTIASGRTVSPREVGATLLGPWVIGVELASFLLLAGLVGAYHLGRRVRETEGGR